MFFNQTRVGDDWSINTEAQVRSYEVQPNVEQLLLRFGANYHVSPSMFVTLGYGHITNWEFDKDASPIANATEQRIWEQIQTRTQLESVVLEQRYRLEQRWIDLDENKVYLNRVRAMIRATIPLGADSIVPSTFIASLYDEFFIHAFPMSFDRNRLYGAIGYQFDSSTNLQLGVMAQTTPAGTRTFVQLALTYNPDLRR